MDTKSTSLAILEKINPELPPEITNATRAFVEALTGIVKSSPTDLSVSLLDIAQRVIAGQKIASVFAEFEKLRKKGKTPPDYLHSLQGQYTLIELLDFLEKGQLDEDIFQVLKKIFLIASTQEESILVQQYMKIAKSLTGGEVIVLLTDYKHSKNPSRVLGQGMMSETQWASVIANESGLKYTELVIANAEKLVTKNLFVEKGPSSVQGQLVRVGDLMRLTTLGYGFCEYISQYETLGK